MNNSALPSNPTLLESLDKNKVAPLVVAISSRALFDFEQENLLFEKDLTQGLGDNSYKKLQLERLEVAATPGVAFSLVNKLLTFNQLGKKLVEVVILSRNDPVSGLRVFALPLAMAYL